MTLRCPQDAPTSPMTPIDNQGATIPPLTPKTAPIGKAGANKRWNIPKPPLDGNCGWCKAELPADRDGRVRFCSGSCNQKYRRNHLKSIGICPVCSINPAEDGKSMCKSCIDYQRGLQEKRRQGLLPKRKTSYKPKPKPNPVIDIQLLMMLVALATKPPKPSPDAYAPIPDVPDYWERNRPAMIEDDDDDCDEGDDDDEDDTIIPNTLSKLVNSGLSVLDAGRLLSGQIPSKFR